MYVFLFYILTFRLCWGGVFVVREEIVQCTVTSEHLYLLSIKLSTVMSLKVFWSFPIVEVRPAIY